MKKPRSKRPADKMKLDKYCILYPLPKGVLRIEMDTLEKGHSNPIFFVDENGISKLSNPLSADEKKEGASDHSTSIKKSILHKRFKSSRSATDLNQLYKKVKKLREEGEVDFQMVKQLYEELTSEANRKQNGGK